MGYSPFLRSVCFWGSFYLMYQYSGRHPITNRQNYPSYAILKEKLIKAQWRDGFDSDKFFKDVGHFRIALEEEVRNILK